jgi:hypothetical protein
MDNISSSGVRRRRLEGDPFFLEGDVLRYTKHEAFECAAGNQEEGFDDQADSMEAILPSQECGIVCTHNGCRRTFTTVASFTAHYETHYSQCVTCGMSFPNER